MPHHLDEIRPGRPWWSWALPLLALCAATAIPAFVWYAADAISGATDGELEATITDPTAPGYEALVATTPSHLLLATGGQGRLTMIAVIGLASNDRGGTVLLFPPETDAGGERLVDIHADGGADATRAAVAALIASEVDAMTVADGEVLATLTGPAGPITTRLVDDLVDRRDDGTRSVVYEAGDVPLAPDEIGQFLAWVNPGESRFNRLSRQQAFWEGWIDAVAARGEEAIPGEADSGIGRMVGGLARSTSIVRIAPVDDAQVTGSDARFTIDAPTLADQMMQVLPFPLPAEPGARANVRLLDGVGGVNVVAAYAPGLVADGAQIIIAGNASSFDVDATAIIVHHDAYSEHARRFAEILGTDNITSQPVTDPVLDVTIVIGRDIEP